MKIHLGCGTRYIDGWHNIDWSTKYKVDHRLDIGREILPFNDDTASEVISSHLIEHLNRWEGEHHLREIYRVLGENGKLILAFPDIIKILDCFEGRDTTSNITGDHKELVKAIFETQKDETSVHKYGYTGKIIKDLLSQVGFRSSRNIKEAVYIDDKKICDYRYAITIIEAIK